uniref:Nucleotide-binding alpha-beta plait domain-containing protein n=1 Tax=Tanacetum cinerariifolium TaxID=118510 RepID=A0A699I3X6_TANCI|nr:nucleotide-binding alpha-beta plait domain-containing protein [Tanacetum cinerariifolium]
MGSHRSKEDDVNRILSSIYVTNFPESFSAKDLFHACKQYGDVVGSFIPTKRSKEGKRFGFVRFINVFNVERLVSNLCTIWVDRFKFHANITRLHRAPLNSRKIHVQNKDERHRGGVNNYRVNGRIVDNGKLFANVVKNNFMPSILVKESDPAIVIDDDCVLDIWGGFWVLLEFISSKSKDLFRDNVWVRSWFSEIIPASIDFNPDGRIVWVEVEGVPFKFWTGKTFSRINAKWGDLLEVFWLRAKEVLGLEPELLEESNDEVQSVNASLEGDDKTHDEDYSGNNSDMAEVPGTVFDDSIGPKENVSDDPFRLYSILNKNNADKNDKGNTDNQKGRGVKETVNTMDDRDESMNTGRFKKSETPCSGGSFLCLMEEVVKVGQTMGYNMEGLWKGRVVIMGDFNEVRYKSDRFGSIFNVQGANDFNSFIADAGLEEVPLGGSPFTWCHKSASKMSKLDRSSSDSSSGNKLQLWVKIRDWIKSLRVKSNGSIDRYKEDLRELDENINMGDGSKAIVNKRMDVINSIQRLDQLHAMDVAQKTRIKGVMVDGVWIEQPTEVKKEFLYHFRDRFDKPTDQRVTIEMSYLRSISTEQQVDLERMVSKEELKTVV